jgi:hypothetical protein
MSSTLCWKKVNKKNESLPDELKYILEKNGYLGIVTSKDIPYFTGLNDAGIKGADEVISAIREHEEVKLFLEY